MKRDGAKCEPLILPGDAPGVRWSFFPLDLACPTSFRSAQWEAEKEEGEVPGLAPSKLCRGSLSSSEVTANSGLLGPRLVSWPQAKEGHGNLVPVFAKALCFLDEVSGQGVGLGTP